MERMDEYRKELEQCLAGGLPYFGHALHANQGHYRFRHFRKIVDLIRETTGRMHLDILEVGSWAGGSLVAWANACNRLCKLTCIDHWHPYFTDSSGTNEEMTRAAESGEILRLFQHNMRTCGLEQLVTPFIGTSEELLVAFREESFDIVYLDGNHLYESVHHDILKAMRLVRNLGVLCGDDLDKQYHEVDQVVCDAAVRDRIPFILDRDLVGYHPGVAKAVAEVFGKSVTHDGLWAKQLTRCTWKDMEL